jgi:hypothetical protein
MTMSKRKGILLTLVAVGSIIAIVGVIWMIEYNNRLKSEKGSNPIIGDKAVKAFSSNVTTQQDMQLSGVKQQIDKKQKLINDFATSFIQYNFGKQTEAIDKDLITQWIIFDNDHIVLDEEKVKNYVDDLAKKYDTVGIERKFVDSHGKTVSVSGGPYGWKIDCEKETEELIRIINQGLQETDREPVYKQKAFIRGIDDIGNTYIEINMSEQKMWFYKEGELFVSTDIVTGNIKRGHGTPSVVGYIHNKARNTNLVGADYVAFVHYWMKVYGSIGIHDASWRNRFGGSIYKTNGSHGCINTPYEKVKTIYNNIEVGTPVILFYEDDN